MFKNKNKRSLIKSNSNRRLRKRVENLFNFKTDKKKIYYLFIVCLILTALLLIRWKNEESALSFQLKSEQELLSPVYSTPTWIENSLIAVATHSGSVIWYDILQAKIVSKIQVNSQIKAPLLRTDVNNDGFFEVIVPTLNKSYGVYDTMGHYLFKGREESPIKSFIAKPAIFKNKGKTYLLLVDKEGHVELVESSYGRKIWQISLNLEENENIVSSPVLHSAEDKHIAFIAGTEGNYLAVDILTGQIYWQKQIGKGFISTGVLSKSSFALLTKEILIWNILGVDGRFFYINALSGEVLLEEEIKTGATSSVAGFTYKGKKYFVGLGQNGSIQTFCEGEWNKLYYSLKDGPFQSSPVLSDVTGDKVIEIIAVHASGKVVVVSLEGELLCQPYYLNAEITATPLLLSIDGKNYLIVATESGKLITLILKSKNNQASHFYLEFLYNPNNNYFF